MRLSEFIFGSSGLSLVSILKQRSETMPRYAHACIEQFWDVLTGSTDAKAMLCQREVAPLWAFQIMESLKVCISSYVKDDEDGEEKLKRMLFMYEGLEKVLQRLGISVEDHERALDPRRAILSIWSQTLANRKKTKGLKKMMEAGSQRANARLILWGRGRNGR